MRLFSTDLNSKWGFNDGDMPERLVDALDDLDINYTVITWHPVLCYLVREYLLPLLPEDTELYEVASLHNPIRCDTELPDVYTDLGLLQILAAIQKVHGSVPRFKALVFPDDWQELGYISQEEITSPPAKPIYHVPGAPIRVL